jgi:hypothetical protein
MVRPYSFGVVPGKTIRQRGQPLRDAGAAFRFVVGGFTEIVQRQIDTALLRRPVGVLEQQLERDRRRGSRRSRAGVPAGEPWSPPPAAISSARIPPPLVLICTWQLRRSQPSIKNRRRHAWSGFRMASGGPDNADFVASFSQ